MREGDERMMELDRRGFLKRAASLFGLTVAAATVPVAIEEAAVEPVFEPVVNPFLTGSPLYEDFGITCSNVGPFRPLTYESVQELIELMEKQSRSLGEHYRKERDVMVAEMFETASRTRYDQF